MTNPYLICDKRFIAGTLDYLSILVWDASDPTTDLSSASAVCEVFDEDGNVVLPSGAATITGTTTIAISRLFDSTGLSGKMRAVFTITFGSITVKVQLAFQVDDEPGPQ